MDIVETSHSKKKYRSFPEHQHGYWEILLNERGSGEFCANGGTWRFSPGTIAVIPPYTPHSKRSDEGFTDRSVFLRSFRDIGKGGVKVFQDDRQDTVKKIFDMIEHFRAAEQPADGKAEAAVVSSLGDTLYHVLVTYYNQSKKKDIRLEGVIDQMNENISNTKFDLSEAICASGYSMGYFRRIFKEMTGQSPVAYLHSLRIGHAKSLFQQYGFSRTIKEIAYQSGFEDPLYFSRIFRKLEGVGPQKYILGLSREITEEDKQMMAMDTPKELL